MEMSMLNESNLDSTANETSFDSKVEVNLAYAVAIPIVCILTVIGNLGTINAFRKLPELWDKPSEMLILSLACADLMTGMIVLPSFAPLWITPGYFPFGENFCRFAVFCGDLSIVAGLYDLVAISLDRFLLVFKEYPQYMKIQTERRIYTVLVVIWLWSIMWSVFDMSLWDFAIKKLDESTYLFDFTKQCGSPTKRVLQAELFVAAVALPVMLVGGLSAAFFYMLHKRLTQSWNMRAESQIGNQLATVSSSVHQKSTQRAMSSEQRKQYIKPALVLSVLVSAMTICILPFAIYIVSVGATCPQLNCLDPEIDAFLLFVLLCNSMLNPFLYAMTQRKILRFYKKMFIKSCRKRK